jgi:hypothetical protein
VARVQGGGNSERDVGQCSVPRKSPEGAFAFLTRPFVYSMSGHVPGEKYLAAVSVHGNDPC